MDRTIPDRVFRVDLDAGTVESERVPERWSRQFVGGKGLGARYLYDELPPGTDPLGSDNLLAFMLGPLSGALPGETRYAAVTKSPLTGAFLDSYSGGSFPDALAGAFDDHVGLLVTGVADEPVVIAVEDGEAELRDATELWGADTAATADAFPNASVACIGPAGENGVAYATIAADGGDHHAGRGGAGAVMGAKGVKAVVARGEPPAELESLRETYTEAFNRDDTGRWQTASETLESVDFANEVGGLSTRGWQEGQFEHAEDIGIAAARDAAIEREHEDDAIPGGFRVETEDGETVPRGATPMTLGAGLGIEEFDAVTALGDVCDRHGMDVISAGNAVAWAIRASQEGLVDRDIEFGDPDGAQKLIEEISARDSPLGDALAAGVERAAATFGGEGLVPTVKQMELPAYDPRRTGSMALAYATSDRGACHRRARPVEREAVAAESWSQERIAATVRREQNARSLLWSFIVDDFVGDVFREDFGAEWLSAVGREYDTATLRQTGERIWNLIRLFNVREGFTREDDELPDALTVPLETGPAAGSVVDADSFEALLDAYYEARDWSEDGRPTLATLERLGLADIDDAERLAADNPHRRSTQ